MVVFDRASGRMFLRAKTLMSYSLKFCSGLGVTGSSWISNVNAAEVSANIHELRMRSDAGSVTQD